MPDYRRNRVPGGCYFFTVNARDRRSHLRMNIEPRSPMMIARAERGIWQRRYWEHTIRNEDDYARRMDYVHFNPVKHGLVNAAADWPYSTFRQAIERGIYPEQWAPLGGMMEGEFGE